MFRTDALLYSLFHLFNAAYAWSNSVGAAGFYTFYQVAENIVAPDYIF